MLKELEHNYFETDKYDNKIPVPNHNLLEEEYWAKSDIYNKEEKRLHDVLRDDVVSELAKELGLTKEQTEVIWNSKVKEYKGFVGDALDAILDFAKLYKEIKDLDNSGWTNIFISKPEVDKLVLFKYESGGIIHSFIDKDMNEKSLEKFLAGNKISGRIIEWMEVPE